MRQEAAHGPARPPGVAAPALRPRPEGRAAGASARTGLTGSAFVRLLAGLVGPQAPLRETRDAFAQGLGRWTAWTDAIALSAALDGPAAGAAGAADAGVRDAQAGEAADEGGDRFDAERVRAMLAETIERDARSAGRSPLGVDLGYGPFRQCHVARQQAMASAIAALRSRVRRRLLVGTPALARLAAVDAALEQVVGTQERRLLAAVPALLERHYHRLRESPADAADGGDPAAAAVDRFRHDLRAVLLAELALRFEPVFGLLEAASQPPR
ncbi:MAG: DUF3348 family protein [Burkholderiaceae bacterium]